MTEEVILFRQLTISELDGILERVFDKIKAEKISEKTTPRDKHFTVEYANFVQTLIIEELNLINSRMSWLLISETFLVASYATLINGFEPQYYEVINKLFWMLPIAGMVLSIVALISILSAEAVLVYLGYKEGQIMEEVNAIYEYEIAEVAGNWDDRVQNLKWTIIGGSIPHLAIPLSIIGFWGFLLWNTPQCKANKAHWWNNIKALQNQFSCSSSFLSNDLLIKRILFLFVIIVCLGIIGFYWWTISKIEKDYKLSKANLSDKAIKVNSQRLLTHLLKWAYQPDERSTIWKTTINKYRIRIKNSFQDRPKLEQYFKNNFLQFYEEARKQASIEEKSKSHFKSLPAECPFTTEEVLNTNYFPE
ncbi:MAG: DUF29 domain-containing protein [Crocosphaera sp.]